MCKYCCKFVLLMLIFSTYNSSRLQYVVLHICSNYYEIETAVTCNIEEFIAFKNAKVNYSNIQNLGGIQIAPAGLLNETTMQKQEIETVLFNKINCPFAVNGGDLPFDIFSAIFYLMTRYEEYLPHQQNQYGQFKAIDSFAHNNNFLHLPIIDIWIDDFKKILLQTYPDIIFKQKQFIAQMTYDIDTAFAYKGKSVFKNIALLGKDIVTGNFNVCKKRIASWQNVENDIYNTYDYIIESNKNLPKPILFFLVGDAHQYNKNLHWQSQEMVQLVDALKDKVNIGIHPSYETPRNKNLISEEKSRLEQLTKNEIDISRQHYLRNYMPTTFNNIIANGITKDYTMGYADMPGFRASTCTPFYFYDLVSDVQTNLLIHPVTFMEGTYAEDLNLTPEDALPQMINLINEVKKVNGEFICIWHNHTLSDYGFWKGWQEIHHKIIEEISN